MRILFLGLFFFLVNYVFAEDCVNSYIDAKARKSIGNKTWYEVDRNQGVKLCPKNDYSKKGIWKVNGTFHVDSLNCAYIDGSPYTRSILALFAQDSNGFTHADSSWILVNQSVVELSKTKHRIWKMFKVGFGKPHCKDCYYEMKFDYDLIVDKTEFTVGEAFHLINQFCKNEKGCRAKVDLNAYENMDSLSILDYPMKNSGFYWKWFAEWRSEQDGLKNVFSVEDESSATEKLVLVYDKDKNKKIVADWNLDGYRLPLEAEWGALQRGGLQSDFFWGNDEKNSTAFAYGLDDHLEVNLHQVAKLAPNPYGLYDVYGNAEESVLFMDEKTNELFVGQECRFYGNYFLGPVCSFQRKIRVGKKGFSGFRLIRKFDY